MQWLKRLFADGWGFRFADWMADNGARIVGDGKRVARGPKVSNAKTSSAGVTENPRRAERKQQP